MDIVTSASLSCFRCWLNQAKCTYRAERVLKYCPGPCSVETRPCRLRSCNNPLADFGHGTQGRSLRRVWGDMCVPVSSRRDGSYFQAADCHVLNKYRFCLSNSVLRQFRCSYVQNGDPSAPCITVRVAVQIVLNTGTKPFFARVVRWYHRSGLMGPVAASA